jgi:predicted adenylyl cyclase CyaB
MSLYEIEIKSLLGSEDNANSLKEKINSKGGVLSGKNKQLNHYFNISDVENFRKDLEPYIEESKKETFDKILKEGSKFSVRTRDADGKVLLVVKASVGSDTSANGVSRMEFESKMDMSIDELDNLLIKAGLEYQAKWSREREEYKLNNVNICIDKNAGYGYLAEFEKMSDDQAALDSVKKELLEFMEEFGVEELQQDRLERMFAYYNNNWKDYYGTEKVFNIE